MSKMINGKSVDCMATSLTIKSSSIDNFLQKIGHTDLHFVLLLRKTLCKGLSV